ncbi:P1 family peptidase [Luteitalea sp.]|uniref:DmpA family aminopeptidase n=1 Tax=Luteitalea sp. TaxID=2004800 RepID=UPI000AB4BB11|nr:P1 family peptidase [Luteitalea sp.]
MLRRQSLAVALLLVVVTVPPSGLQAQGRARARELGVAPGVFAPGPLNGITDVAGVRVGQVTIIEGDDVRTGVTAILPHEGNPYLERVPAALHVGNGYGKLLGVTQLRELGELETPILLTCTLCVWKAADAMTEWMLERDVMAAVGSINPVVGETNDGGLNAIRRRPIGADHVRRALDGATSGPVAEGSVGAGTGTVAFGWKGGIGTSSRVLPVALGGWTVGVLVQSNFGGVLQVLGAPVGKALGQYAFRDVADQERGDGSIMIVVATDAPLSDRNLERLAARGIMGLARTGSSASNGSGDYVLAFSTAREVRRRPLAQGTAGRDTRQRTVEDLANEPMSGLFQAVVEATEEAIYNSMFAATTVTGNGRTVEALPLDKVRAVLSQYGIAVP